MDPEAAVRTYYDALDAGAYDELEAILAPEFVQYRPDRSLVGREEFVRFMREDRPNKATRHDVRDVLVDGERAVARGVLGDSGGGELFAFADVFDLEDGTIVRLETYTR